MQQSMLSVGETNENLEIIKDVLHIGQRKSLRYYRPKNSGHGTSTNTHTNVTVERSGQQRQYGHLQDVNKGMVPSSESHPYEVVIMHLPSSSSNNKGCYENVCYCENGAVSVANMQVQTSGGVPVRMGKTSDLLPQEKKKPPVKRKPKRTKIPSPNGDNDHLWDPHPGYTVPVSMYDVLKLEYGGEPEDRNIDVACPSNHQQPSEAPIINTSCNYKVAGKKQSELYYRKVDGNQVQYYNKQVLNQDENGFGYYNQRDMMTERHLL